MDNIQDINFDWFAIYVQTKHEFKVLEYLRRLRIESFLPVLERKSQWKDRKKFIFSPLFPGYLFVQINRNYENVLKILKIAGVVRFVGTQSLGPEPVPSQQIDDLKKILENTKQVDPYPYLKEGHRVRIRRGPLAGVEGVLVEKRGQHSLVLSVDLIQQGVSVNIDAADVEPLT
jgi:transcription antitermination factor NusG